MRDSRSETTSRCEAFTFVSSKGGTGKTIIAASLAYALRISGKRVVLVDTDFSTRGLSLYLLASAIDSEEVWLEHENCLAETIIARKPPESIVPRTIVRDGTTYDVVFANSNIYEGGAPDDRLLGIGDDVQSASYHTFMTGLIDHLRDSYDYVILDTRGGIDYTNIAPAIESDGFIVVLEADQLSLDQVNGVLKKIDARTERSNLRGFIVNKAVFSAEDRQIEKTLRRLYRGGKTFGVIPSDDDTIRAYQREQIPLQSTPGSPFSYYALAAFDRVLGDRDHWSSEENERFDALIQRSVTLFGADSRAKALIARLPYVHLFTLVTAIGLYVAYRRDAVTSSAAAYIALSIAVLFSLGTATTGVIRTLRRRSISRLAQLMVRTGMFGVFAVALYLLIVDIPAMFARTPLLERLKTQQESLLDCKGELTVANERLQTHAENIDLLRRAQEQLTQDLDSSRRQTVVTSAERDALNIRMLEITREVARLTSDRNTLIRQVEVCRSAAAADSRQD